MHKELQRETRRASERVQENAKVLESRRGDLLEKFKAQNDLLVSQLGEEQAKGDEPATACEYCGSLGTN